MIRFPNSDLGVIGPKDGNSLSACKDMAVYISPSPDPEVAGASCFGTNLFYIAPYLLLFLNFKTPSDPLTWRSSFQIRGFIKQGSNLFCCPSRDKRVQTPMAFPDALMTKSQHQCYLPPLGSCPPLYKALSSKVMA